MRSSRTCAADTTNSASIPSPAAGSRWSSPNSPLPSDSASIERGIVFIPNATAPTGEVRADPIPLEDPADRGCADAVAELKEFALDALAAPRGLVLAGHPFN